MEKLKAHSLLEMVFAAENLGILSRSDRHAVLARSLKEESPGTNGSG